LAVLSSFIFWPFERVFIFPIIDNIEFGFRRFVYPENR
jgi:hypothetical protein